MPKGVYERTEEIKAGRRATMIANGTTESIIQSRPEVIAKGLATRVKNGTTNKIVCNRPEYKTKMSIIKQEVANRADYAETLKRIKTAKIRNGTTEAIVNNRPEYRKKLSIAIRKALSTPEARAKMSMVISGEKNPMWQGGISFEPYSIDWTETLRQSIRERDHYICQLCSNYGNTVHHIDYDKKNCNSTNLVTLCDGCNKKVNANRNYWTKFFREIIELILMDKGGEPNQDRYPIC
ncbi:hypothetical protein ES705_34965 [subsurface metagenome]